MINVLRKGPLMINVPRKGLGSPETGQQIVHCFGKLTEECC